MRYEVQHYTIIDGWVNTWSYNEGDGVMRPETFATREEAEAALAEHLQDLDEEFLAGHCGSYSSDEFRVAPVVQLAQQEGGRP